MLFVSYNACVRTQETSGDTAKKERYLPQYCNQIPPYRSESSGGGLLGLLRDYRFLHQINKCFGSNIGLDNVIRNVEPFTLIKWTLMGENGSHTIKEDNCVTYKRRGQRI